MCYMYTPTTHTATPTRNKAHAELEANWTAGRRCDSVTALETPTVVEDIARHQRRPKDLAPGGDEGIAAGEAGAAAFLHPLQPLHKALLAALQELQKPVFKLKCPDRALVAVVLQPVAFRVDGGWIRATEHATLDLQGPGYLGLLDGIFEGGRELARCPFATRIAVIPAHAYQLGLGHGPIHTRLENHYM